MNSLLIALCAGALAFGPASALADDFDTKPLSKMDTEQAKAARAAAQERWAKMTPEEQAAAKKAAQRKKLADATALDRIALQEGGAMKDDRYNRLRWQGDFWTNRDRSLLRPTPKEQKPTPTEQR